jgi:trehalose utilization protein
MQALVDGKSIKNIYNESQTIPNNTEVYSISCLGCGAIMNERKCYATQGGYVFYFSWEPFLRNFQGFHKHEHFCCYF